MDGSEFPEADLDGEKIGELYSERIDKSYNTRGQFEGDAGIDVAIRDTMNLRIDLSLSLLRID
jgi:hypothetical protein